MNKVTLRLLLAITVAASAHAQTVYNQIPTNIVGQAVLQQLLLTATAPNLVEGREFNLPEAVAIDASSSPPILYVADTANNRVLAWKNAAGFTKGDFADKVIGQRDFLSTGAKGPGSDLSSGLNSPVALTVDKRGNLYVIDAGNNRVVRYPAPFQQTSPLLAVDLILGQPDSSSRSANQGQQSPSATTLSFTSGGGALHAGLAFDSAGNLWLTDAGNNRVLRFSANALAQGVNQPAADSVLGQGDFLTSTLPPNPQRTGKNFLAAPSSVAFDPQGRMYVTDDGNRVLVYVSPFFSGAPASRIMGVIVPTQQNPNPPRINETTLGFTDSQGIVHPPLSVFFVGNNPFVVDTGNHRILKFDTFDQWPVETVAFSPPGTAVFGQADFLTFRVNRGQPQPSESSLAIPAGSAFFNNQLYLADSGNNRVLVIPLGADGLLSGATRLLGQTDFKYNAPNLIEGREFFFQAGFNNGIAVGGGSVVIDTASNPPHLYVSDPLNNRVLGYKDYRRVNAGAVADLVIGQPDFSTSEVNYPRNDAVQVNDAGLFFPEGLALDSAGNLWVADRLNGRVLRFPRPFDQAQTVLERPNLVIGQVGFFQKVTDASSQTMREPYGIAFTAQGHLLVSDAALNRILFFLKPSGGDFTNGQFAANVIGQPNFGPPTETTLASPHLIATDPDDRLYVADTGNNRILIYRNVPSAGNDPTPSFALNTGTGAESLNRPHGVFVNQNTGEIWVADTLFNNLGRLLRYPQFQQLVAKPSANASLVSLLPLAVGLDPFGNPVAVEGAANRIAFFSPSIDFTASAGGVPGRFSGNAANYFGRFAPGMLASIFAFPASRFGDQTATFDSKIVPISSTLGDVQVVVGGIPAPLLFVSPAQINLQIPYGIPVGSDPQEIRVVRASTGQILASSLFRVEQVSPGLFTATQTGSGQLAVVNQDGSINDGTHPAKAGTFISLYGTGLGAVSGAPPDGTPAQGLIMTDEKPQVFINPTTGPIDPSDVTFSGLAPGFVGLWQINAKVPANVPPGDVPVLIIFKGINSNLDQNGNRRQTTIRTTP